MLDTKIQELHNTVTLMWVFKLMMETVLLIQRTLLRLTVHVMIDVVAIKSGG